MPIDIENLKTAEDEVQDTLHNNNPDILSCIQHATAKLYQFVPMQNFNEVWTDEKLYKKYNLTQDEINYIESMIKPMEISDE